MIKISSIFSYYYKAYKVQNLIPTEFFVHAVSIKLLQITYY